MSVYTTTLLVYLSCTVLVCASNNDYKSRRDKIKEDEAKMAVGGNIKLDDNETLVNNVLMQWKREELDQGFQNPQYFNFSRSYFEYKDAIEKSKVYQLIRRMPKGAALHVHGPAILGSDYYLNITYKEHLHVCFGNILQFKFASKTPEEPCETQWRLMSDVRKSLDVKKFDSELRQNFTLVSSNLRTDNSERVWTRFNKIFIALSNLWAYRPVWEEYIYDTLQAFRKDNVMYIEIRSFLPQLYELDGNHHNELFFTNITNAVVERFKRDHPDFLGVRIICSFSRYNSNIEELLRLTKESKIMFPEFVAGFDLVGHEDDGRPLVGILPQLEAAKSELDYFFHAGETNWYGTTIDENLIDAVLLGSKRLGHAYALLKHPLVLEEVKKNKIGLEVSLVSNNVLGLVKDMRNHPFAVFIAEGLPVVLSSDDPGLWDAEPLSTDFYVGFMGVASRSHDLRLLKQLALNSIEYSSLTEDKKTKAYALFSSQWRQFINDFVEDI